MRLPLQKPIITSKYGERMLNGSKSWHPGMDFVAGDGDVSVFAIADGTVVFDFDGYDERQRWDMSSNSSGGNFVILKHNLKGVDYFVRYFHLKENTVTNGQKIKEGDLLGHYADVGYSYGAHLHVDMTTVWGRWGNVDPWAVLGP